MKRPVPERLTNLQRLKRSKMIAAIQLVLKGIDAKKIKDQSIIRTTAGKTKVVALSQILREALK